MITEWLRGVFPPIPTPFDEAGELALDRLVENLGHWASCPLNGLVVLGSNGEAVHLDRDERKRMIEVVSSHAPQSRPIIAGTGAHSTRETIGLSRDAADAGARAVLVLSPSYYRNQMTPDALADHFTAVADGAPVPVIVYNMPACTGIDLDAGTIARIAGHENVIGLKDSSGNVTKLATLRAMIGPEFGILAGSGGFFLPALSVGADGGVMSLANVASKACARIFEAFQSGDLETARALQLRLVPLNTAITTRWGVPGLKAAMDLVGLYGGPVRSPLRPVDESAITELGRLLRSASVLS